MQINIDLFLSYNDRYGIVAGDTMLRQLYSLLSAELGPIPLYRTKGDVFSILLESTGASPVADLAEKLRQLVENQRTPNPYPALNKTDLTVSIGVLVTNTPFIHPSLDHVLHTLDAMTYKAKAGGRNQVAVLDLTR